MLLSICFVLLCVSCKKMTIQDNLHGVWEGNSNGKALTFKFASDQRCIFSIRDDETGVVETVKGSYDIDFSKHPISLSVKSIPQLNYPLHTIIKFVGTDSISLAPFSPREKLRQITFNRKTNINLKRSK